MQLCEKIPSTFLISNLTLDKAWHDLKKNIYYQIKLSPPFERGAGKEIFFAAQLEGLQFGIKIIIDIYEKFAIGKKHRVVAALKK
jgi:hypothetical protein